MKRKDYPSCCLPWVYFSSLPNGDIHPCCINDKIIFDNIDNNNAKTIWNSENIKKLRRSFMYSDTLPKECARCKFSEELTKDFESETNSTFNLRFYYNKQFKNSIKEIYDQTLEDGTIPEDKIKFIGWNFRLSNKCNFKCRICSPQFSSAIQKEEDPNSYHITETFYYKDFLEDNINDLELIEISGGETLIWSETYDMLDYLLKMNKQDQIKLYFNTNMSVLGLGQKIMLDYWKKWNPEKLEVVASIDEIGERAECIRKGTKWEIIEKNLKEISKEKFICNTNITVSLYNVYRLPEIIQYLVDIGYINEKHEYANFMFNLVDQAEEFILLLSPQFRDQCSDKIIKFVKEYEEKYSVNIEYKFSALLKLLSYPEIFDENKRSTNILNFISREVKLNEKRNENIFKVIPELKDILLQAKPIYDTYKNDRKND